MKKQNPLRLAILAIALGLGTVGAAQAAPSWQFTDSGLDTSGPVNNIATSSYSNSATTLNISGAYASTISSNWNTTTSNTGQSATLNFYSGGGLGMNSDGDTQPNHAIDNNGKTEAVLLSFGKSVKLTSIGLGYVGGDADISLFRYIGTSVPPANLNTVGASLASMTSASAGWSLVGNYADLTADTSNPFNLVNASGLASSWWLISAYNSAYGTTSSNGGVLTNANDYFKIYAVAANCATTNANGTCGGGGTPGTGVPEPASLALVSLGMLGIAGVRRRRSGPTV